MRLADPEMSRRLRVLIAAEHASARFGGEAALPLHYFRVLKRRGVPVWHANFEPIPSLTVFAGEGWERWLPRADVARTRANYQGAFPVAARTFADTGLGLGKMNFLSRQNLRHLVAQLDALCRSR